MKIRGPLVTLGAVAVLGVGILLVNMSKEESAPPGKPAAQSTTTVAPTTAAAPPAPTTPPPPAFPAQADYVGKIPTANGTITLEITVQGDKAVAYACDGNTDRVVAAGQRCQRSAEPCQQRQDEQARGSPRGECGRRHPVDRREEVGLQRPRCPAARRTLCLRERRRPQQLDRRPEWGSDRRATAGGRVDRTRAPADDRRHRESSTASRSRRFVCKGLAMSDPGCRRSE